MGQIEQYDAVVIGSGQSGGPLSTALVEAGRRTALIEREHIGGCCINEGCTPTKTMVASARVAYLGRRSADYGVHGGDVRVDMRAVRQRKRDIVRTFREGSTERILKGGVDIIMGEGRFMGPHSIEVGLRDGGTSRIEAESIVINTGCRPASLPLPGLDSVPHLNSTSIMELDEVPEHLVVLGGGYVGLEFGQMFRRFGSQVTIVERGPKLMGHEDADITEAVTYILRQDGIEVILNADVELVELGDGGIIHIRMMTPEEEREIAGSHLLIAAGRSPNTEALRLETAGVETDQRGFVNVNDRLESSVPGVYAMGDVAGSPQFTHISYDDFRILRDNLLHGEHRSRAGRLVPYTMFTDPQLGRIGLSEEEARRKGRAILVATLPASSIARAIEVNEQRGMIKAVIDANSGEIIGAASLCIEGGEVMAMFEIAMLGKLPYTVLREGIFAHPTLAEMFNNLLSSVGVPDPRTSDLSSVDGGSNMRSRATAAE